MRAFEKIKEKYKDGWWEGHDGYSPEEMFNDIEFLIGFGEESLNREADLVNNQSMNMSKKLRAIKGIGEIYEILKEMEKDNLNKIKSINPNKPLLFNIEKDQSKINEK